jgi:hypothetical protein
MMVVQIEKPSNMTLAKWFSELRSWFDKNSCQPSLFNQSEAVTDKMIFNVTLTDETQARSFSDTFVKFAP